MCDFIQAADSAEDEVLSNSFGGGPVKEIRGL